MPTWSWILVWVVLVGVVAALYVREKRRGRTLPPVDRQQHRAVREAEADAHLRGPNGGSQGWLG